MRKMQQIELILFPLQMLTMWVLFAHNHDDYSQQHNMLQEVNVDHDNLAVFVGQDNIHEQPCNVNHMQSYEMVDIHDYL